MELNPNYVYHIYNRGNQKQPIFFKEENYLFFLRKARKELTPYCDILAYCLMPNHFHFLVYVKEAPCHPMTSKAEGLKLKPTTQGFEQGHRMTTFSSKEVNPLSNGIAVLLRSYTRAVQIQEIFTGSLFQQKTKAKEISDWSYLLTCATYIHQNPFKAKLVTQMEDWVFSSFKDYCGLRGGTLCNKELLLQLSGIRPDEDFRQLSYNMIKDEDLLMIL